MANVIIKSDERRAYEAYVLENFGKHGCNITKLDREAAECIAARTRETYRQLKRMEEKNR